jgi:DNA-binding CsgD family transcriptional regulator
VVAAGCAVQSALWPVEYASTGVTTRHPLGLGGGDAAATVWGAVAHPAYAVFQLLWVPAVIVRWRRSGRLVRVQLAWVALAAALSGASLVAGLAVLGTPRLGLLTAGLVPVAAGWAIVHGQHLATYSALSWLSRAGVAQGLPADLARAVAEALDAPRATVWIGDEEALDAAGGWPEGGDGDAAVSLATLRTSGLLVRPVTRDGTVIGAISVDRPAADRMSLTEQRLVDDLAAQAALVIEHVAPFREAAPGRATGDLTRLSPRERQVLELMARGLSNAAICAELHLSIKTVEPVISGIFTKLGLDPDAASNRRVLAVLAFMRA